MPSVEDFLEDFFIKHADVPYDPVKAHEYYVQNRQLLGRTPGGAQPSPPTKGSPAQTAAINKQVAKAVPPPKSSEQKRKEAEARVAALQAKLEKLRKVLQLLVKQAKARSGVTTPAKKAVGSASAPSKGKSDQHLTAKQKADKAKASKEAYDKNPKTQEANVQQQIAEVTKKIKDLKAQIAKARTDAEKRTSSSVGVKDKNNK